MTWMNIICVQIDVNVYIFPQLAHCRTRNAVCVCICLHCFALKFCAISIRLLEIPMATKKHTHKKIKSRGRKSAIHRCQMETIENTNEERKGKPIPFDCISVAFQLDYISTWLHIAHRNSNRWRLFEVHSVQCCCLRGVYFAMHRSLFSIRDIIMTQCVYDCIWYHSRTTNDSSVYFSLNWIFSYLWTHRVLAATHPTTRLSLLLSTFLSSLPYLSAIKIVR